jgi:carboxymethylenebutenolidase
MSTDGMSTDEAPAVEPAPGSPGVVVVHDWHGVLPHVADIADELAMAGFDVEVVDLYGGETAHDPDRGEALAEDLDGGAARELIAEAVERLRAGGARHVGAVGFSLGGSLLVRAAAHGLLDALVVYYATTSGDDAAAVTCPVQLHLAEDDELEPAEDMEAFAAALRDGGIEVDTFTYPGTGHFFANTDLDLAVPAAAETAFARTVGFLHARLAG